MVDNISFDLCRCGKTMRRDYHAERVGVVADRDMAQADIDLNIEQRRTNQEVDRPVLARSLARVPGVRKITGKDGKRYAFFENQQERTRTLKRLGLPTE